MLERAEGWKNRHGAKFETTKYILIHFTRNKHRKTDSPVTIANVTIQPSREARYLGVIFDKNLRFKQHLQYAAKKGTKFALAISRITKATWGPTFNTYDNSSLPSSHQEWITLPLYGTDRLDMDNKPPQHSFLNS